MRCKGFSIIENSASGLAFSFQREHNLLCNGLPLWLLAVGAVESANHQLALHVGEEHQRVHLVAHFGLHEFEVAHLAVVNILDTIAEPGGILVLLVIRLAKRSGVHVHHVLVGIIIAVVEGEADEVVIGENNARAALGFGVGEVHLLLGHYLETLGNQDFNPLAEYALLHQLNFGQRLGSREYYAQNAK